MSSPRRPLRAGLVAAAFALALATLPVPAARSAPPEAKQKPTWGEEPVETLSATRGRVVLNGLWRYVPAVGPDEKEPRDWGLMPVPGTWATPKTRGANRMPSVFQRGSGEAWKGLGGDRMEDAWNALSRAWYERPLTVPAAWAGREITLDFTRVSTDAQVFIDGKEAGRLAWPGGKVDITRFVTPGREATLRVLVIAGASAATEQVFMGTAAGQIETREVKLETRGITNDVFLTSQPRGPRVSDVFVQTSTRKGTLTLDVELENVAAAGPVTLSPVCLNEKGEAEKVFPAQIVNARPGKQVVKLTFPWPNPRLWDFGQPNLYTLRLRAAGPGGWSDDYAQPFGFREFWVEGRGWMLNNTPFRMRQVLFYHAGRDLPQIEMIDGVQNGLRELGFNVQELEAGSARGSTSFDDLIYERANLKGWALIGGLQAMASIADKWKTAPGGGPSPEQMEWRARIEGQLRRLRNHPSIILWTHTVNRYGGWDDQSPYRIGNNAMLQEIEDERQRPIVPAGIEAGEFIKTLDPTRNVGTHQSGRVGDWHTNNSYLNWIPFQEQEEWLSEWVKTGDKPYQTVEFGFLLGCDFKRGRMPGMWSRGQGATYTEHLTTERLASLFGPLAYEKETPGAREVHAKAFLPDATEDHLGKPLDPKFKLQYYKDQPQYLAGELGERMMEWHYRDIYRSWRTMGGTGGMMPWEYTKGTSQNETQTPVGPFVPGRRGTYAPTVSAALLHYFQPKGLRNLSVRVEGLKESNSPTLAWICGAEEPDDVAAFTSKDHSFSGGSTLKKRVALLNDTRREQPYTVSWRVTTGNGEIATREASGKLAVGTTAFVPIEAALPAATEKTDGKIEATVRIGDVTHKDTFAFRVFPPLAPAKETVAVFDPAGKTTALLAQLGYETQPWNGEATANNHLLIVGREALGSGKGSAPTVPGDLAAFARGGGRVLVMTQQPEFLKAKGFRVGFQVPREAFPVHGKHPVVAGLDQDDLANWTGHSTLVEPRPRWTLADKEGASYPRKGWRWGNRGAVSSATLEKPHRAGWRPLLEFDFDLAYTPLMELDHGAGRVTLCTLDLEDHAAADPAVALLARNVVEHARTAPLTPKATETLFVGTDAGAARLTALGVQFTRAGSPAAVVAVAAAAKKAPEAPSLWTRLTARFSTVANDTTAPEAAPAGNGRLLIVEPGAPGVDEAALNAFAQAGGTVFVLPAAGDRTALGLTLTADADFYGALSVPDWPLCAGLSRSDVRYRAPRPTPLFAKTGAPDLEVGLDGLLARRTVGAGQIVLCQLDPDRFDADKVTYFRFTRWRHTRALSQVLANAGATFAGDGALFGDEKFKDLYHPDYRTDQHLGDDPHRYYRW